MHDPRIPLKSRYMAGILAFLCPGAGHWYQGRRFKATIYSVCILTIFIWGMILGNLQPVYSQVAFSHSGGSTSVQLDKGRPGTRYTLGYYAQVLTGVVALPALVQQARFQNDEGVVAQIDRPIDSDFVGVVRDYHASARTVTGTLNLSPAENGKSSGQFSGQFEDGTPVTLEVLELNRFGRKVFGSPRRDIECRVTAKGDTDTAAGEFILTGTVARSFVDWFQAPRDMEELDRLHGELNRQFDLASVFTWIAGLLNLLAIWDAFDGPAYGYGDETRKKDDEKSPEPA
jgi:hypothetical protein